MRTAKPFMFQFLACQMIRWLLVTLVGVTVGITSSRGVAWSDETQAPTDQPAEQTKKAKPCRSPAHLPIVTPREVGFDAARLKPIDGIVEAGIAKQRMPGCVIAFGRQGKLAWLKAYGHRQVEPTLVPMTTDTVFDMASITKPMATATSIMILVEQGKVRLRNRFADYFPDFAVHGKRPITVTQLLTHHGGLIPDNPISDYDDGREEAWNQILNLNTYVEPGTQFVYTDVGFIALAELVRKESGLDIHQFSQKWIFQPLGMVDTGYLPNDSLRGRCATTEQRDGHWMQGEVHDPRAYRLGGVAGHAGLFSTAEDIAVYAQMMLQEGRYQNARILSPAAVRVMTRAYDISGNSRGLGWDKLSVYSSNRGETFSSSAFGHGGFTGTVLWIDPELDLFFIFLSNRVHPDGSGNINSLAGRIATVVAGAIDPLIESDKSARTSSPLGTTERTGADKRPTVRTGLEVLRATGFAALQNQRVGLITNHTGIDPNYRSTAQVLHTADDVNLVALFSPEHGIAGRLEQARIEDMRDPETGLPIFSLYGKSRRPTPEQLDQVDTLVFDIQDIGARFYTYISTMGMAMEAAAEHGKCFVVLDRPNPINGIDVDGPVLDEGRQSFVAYHAVPIRHGMTVGELAKMFCDERQLSLNLEVVEMENWCRAMYWDATGLPWVNPSPNMRNLNQAILYPGIGLLETTNVSVGRGTDTPFQWLGAPWIDELELAARLNQLGVPGARFVPCRFTPESSVFAEQLCHGVRILIVDRRQLNPLDVGFAVASTLRQLHPDQWDVEDYDRLLRDQQALIRVKQGASPGHIRAGFQDELHRFEQRRAQYLIYP